MKRKAFPWIRPPGPIAPGLKIGLLGGSFNPAHAGHIHISEVALKRLGLDYVWWLIAPQNPLRPTQGMAPLSRRLEFAEAEASGHPRIVVMDIEHALGTSYTIDTLMKLKRATTRDEVESLLDEVEQRLRKPHRMIIAAQTMRHVRHLLSLPAPDRR